MQADYRAVFVLIKDRVTLDYLVDFDDLQVGKWRYATMSEFLERHNMEELKDIEEGKSLMKGEWIECQDGVLVVIEPLPGQLSFESIQKANIFAVIPNQGRQKIFSALPVAAISLEDCKRDNPELNNWEIELIS